MASALGGQQRTDDDDAVDDPGGVIGACELLNEADDPGIIRVRSADQHGGAVAGDVGPVVDLDEGLVEAPLYGQDAAEG